MKKIAGFVAGGVFGGVLSFFVPLPLVLVFLVIGGNPDEAAAVWIVVFQLLPIMCIAGSVYGLFNAERIFKEKEERKKDIVLISKAFGVAVLIGGASLFLPAVFQYAGIIGILICLGVYKVKASRLKDPM